MKNYKKIGVFILFLLLLFMFSFAYSYIPENTEENSFKARIVEPFFEVSDLINDGIKAIRQEVISSSYKNEKESKLKGDILSEKESGEEKVTSKKILYYEPKEEIYEAKELMEEILLWLNVYRTVKGDDVLTFKRLKKYAHKKYKYLNRLISALKYEKDNKDSVLKYKRKIKKMDKYFKKYLKRLKGKIVLIEGKPLPEAEEE